MLVLVSDGCLVLDFDGTILDTEEPVYRSWAELWEAHGHQLVLSEWQVVIGTDSSFDPWAEFERALGSPLDPDLKQRRRARRDELQAAHAPRAGVISWLDQAQAGGVPVGIASSSPREWVDAHLDRIGLRRFFSCIVCADTNVPAKPDPMSYRLACQRLGADPARSVAVEDSPHGVSAAVAAGLFTVAVPHALTADLDLSAANMVIASLEGLSLADTLAESCRRTGSHT